MLPLDMKPDLLKRKEQEIVTEILSPPFINSYYLVTGKHRTGKTTIVQQATKVIQEKAKRNKEPTDIIYVKIYTKASLEKTDISLLKVLNTWNFKNLVKEKRTLKTG
ncbi:hypothetical protein QOT17_018145 [Balamuthia mandrillaris]